MLLFCANIIERPSEQRLMFIVINIFDVELYISPSVANLYVENIMCDILNI